jgi:hypothetical protein
MSLSLLTLAAATGTSPASIGNAEASTATANLTSFTIDGVSSVTNNGPVSYGSNFTVTTNFTNPRANFSRISGRSSNYTNTGTPADTTLVSNDGSTITYTNNYNPGGTNGSSSTTSALGITFYDKGYNAGVSNYNTQLNTTITLYSPPSPTISFNTSTAPPQPCSGGSPCLGATITINYDAGSYQGVNGSTVTIYLSQTSGSLGSLYASIGNASGAYTLGSGGDLYGSTVYYITVVNNYNCYSTQLAVTTPAYV